MTKTNKVCQECGQPHTSNGRFCATSCRQRFNNRRLQRGAEMYDLFRALRRERGKAKELNIWTELCRLELRWQQEDEKERPGRRSYQPPQAALMNLYDTGRLQRGDILV